MYVMAKYIDNPKYIYEWECMKCSKVYRENSIPTPESSEQDKELHERLENGKRRDSKRAMRSNQ